MTSFYGSLSPEASAAVEAHKAEERRRLEMFDELVEVLREAREMLRAAHVHAKTNCLCGRLDKLLARPL